MESPATVSRPSPSWMDRLAGRQNLLAVLLLLLATQAIHTKIFTSDFGTHIAKGRQVVQTLSIPGTEFLNYPRLGAPTDNAEWGFQALLYLVHSAGGELAVSFLVWAIIACSFLLILRATVVRGANPLLAVLCILAFSGFLRIRVQPRPEILTYLYISISLYILSEYFYGQRKRLIYGFPALAVVWANSHPTYLMMFILFVVFFLDRLARAAWNRELRWGTVRAWAITPVAVGIASFLLIGLNPYGFDTLLAPIHLLTKGESLGGGHVNVLSSISELTPVYGTGFYRYFKAAAVLAVVSIVLGAIGRGVHLLDLILFALSFKGAWDAARAVSMMGIFLAPGIALQLSAFLRFVWSRAGREAPGATAGRKDPASGKGKDKGKARPAKPEPPVSTRTRPLPYLVTAVLVNPLVAFGVVILSFSFSQLEYGIGKTKHKFSFAAAEFLRKNPVPGKMFNFFDIGGFLDWQLYPGALTFIDGRTNSGSLFMEHQIVTSGMQGWEGIIRKYGITHMVLKAMDSSGMILPIVPLLANDTRWRLVFADGLFLVFVLDLPETTEYIRKFEIPKSIIPQHIINEAFHYIYLGVSPANAYNTMTNMYLVMGNRGAAIENLRSALKYEDDPFLRGRLRELEAGAVPPGGRGNR